MTRVEYHFQDSSTPPEHHRSKTITATPEEIIEEIDSYGKVLSRRQRSLSAEEYSDVLKALLRHQIGHVERQPSRPCSGGTGESVKVFAGDERVFFGSVYRCAGDSGNLGGNVAALRGDLEHLVDGRSPKQ